MPEVIFHSTRWIHIVSGTLALTSGLVALGLSQKTSLHRPVGKVYFYSMIAVFLTAIVLSLVQHIEFLFCLAFLSFYGAFSGIRALRFLKGAPVHWADWLAATSVALCAVYLIGRGAMSFFQGGGGVAFLFIFFGFMSLFIAGSSSNDLLAIEPGDKKWFRAHQSGMGGGLIATVTAFSANTLDFLPGLVQWLWPTILLSPVLSFLIRIHPLSRKSSKHLS